MEDVLRKKGLDPHLVYQPESEYFFGRSANLMKYRPSLQEKAHWDAQQKAVRAGTLPPASRLGSLRRAS
jgi:hypothetical protein